MTHGSLRTVVVVGGGPAGLHAATLIKRDRPSARVTVFEQNPANATFGFGVVFSDRALDFLKEDDAHLHAALEPELERWNDITLNHPGESITIDGVGFAAIGRLQLLQLLQARAEAAGVELRYGETIAGIDDIEADLIIGADGVNSLVRTSAEDAFRPSLTHLDNRFCWFGANCSFDTLTQTFIETEFGSMNAHHYRYAPDRSTFIVECGPDTFEKAGLAELGETASADICSRLFDDALEGTALTVNHSHWRRFPLLWCERWVSGNRVLIGDSAHTAHFSIGSGTRLALEDATALAAALRSGTTVEEALVSYEKVRQPVARKIVDAANRSASWYETFDERMRQPPLDFACDYITRSGRLAPERLRAIAPEFAARYARKPA